jgi:hypothetical protein
MYYIIYLSSASHLMTDEELKQLLIISNRNNQKENITGLLLYNDGSIIQVLEGEKEAVKALYDKIYKDHRHNGILKLDEGELSHRNFPDWSMGFKSVSAVEFKKLAGFKEVGNKDIFAQSTSEEEHKVLTLLKVFYKSNIKRF